MRTVALLICFLVDHSVSLCIDKKIYQNYDVGIKESGCISLAQPNHVSGFFEAQIRKIATAIK
jgi:hypothetical protein